MSDDVHDTSSHLDVVAAQTPPPSRLNDSIVVLASAGAALCGVGFGVALVLGAPLVVHGGLLALSLLLFGGAVRRYFVARYPDVDAVEPRTVPGAHDEGPVSDVPPMPERRSFVTRALLWFGVIFGVGIAAPPIASLGPAPGDTLKRTAWTSGRRLVTSDGLPVRPDDVASGGVASIWPEGAIGEERSAVILLRLEAAPQAPTNPDWVVDGVVVAYSKICTHAGCPVALFRERDQALFCPCHQSTFAPARGAVVTFGPAERALPQLPLAVDEDGFLIATSDFTQPVGPAANTTTS